MYFYICLFLFYRVLQQIFGPTGEINNSIINDSTYNKKYGGIRPGEVLLQ